MTTRDSQEDRRLVREAVAARGLVSVMNDTKWLALVDGVLSILPFAPAFQIKDILADAPFPESIEESPWYLGDWIEGLLPFYSVEWIKVAPRHAIDIGKLLAPRVEDCKDGLLKLLSDRRIPHRVTGRFVEIFGYIHDTASLG